VTTTVLSPAPILDFVDNNGNPLVGGQLFTYQAGTSTPASVYADPLGATPFPNPIVLNSRGEPTIDGPSLGIWLSPGVGYKFILSPSTDTNPPTNPFWTLDNISTGSNAIQLPFLTDTGTTNALAVALSPTPSSYSAGQMFYVLVANTNTGATTINVSSLGAKNVTLNGSPLLAGALQAGQVYQLTYDGSAFELTSVPGPGGWVANAYLASMAKGTVKANVTTGSAQPTDVLVSTLILDGMYGADSGSANAYAVAPVCPPSSYTAGLIVAVKIVNTNTGASTLNVNAIGAIGIRYQGSAIAAGLLTASVVAVFIYDGSYFELINPGAGTGNSGGSTTISYPANSTVGTISSQGWYQDGPNIVNWAVMNLQDYGNGNYTGSGTWTYTKAFTNGNILGVVCQNVAVLASQTSGGYPARGTGMPVTLGATTAVFCAQNTDQTNTVAAYYLEVKGN